MVVAIIALVVACAGTATAARVLISNSSQVATGAIDSEDLRNGRAVGLTDLTPRTRFSLRGEPGPAGPEGPRGEQGSQGPPGLTGPAGADGADGSAIAFAHVNENGTLEEAQSKGVLSVAIPPSVAPVYCFDLVSTPRNAVGSISAARISTRGIEAVYPLIPETPPGDASAFIAAVCPAAQQDAAAVVFVYDAHISTDKLRTQRPFFIAFN